MLDAMVLRLDVEQLQAVGTTCWLLKDLGWVLLLPQLSWTAAVAALWIDAQGIAARWNVECEAERLHGISVFLWLFGNAIWMTTEMLFESSPEIGRRFPWFHGPLTGVHEDAARWGVQASQGCFLAALAIVVPFYALSAYRWAVRRWSYDHDLEKNGSAFGLVLGGLCSVEVYQMVFVGPWVLKDLFWTVDWLLPSLPCALVVLVIMADYVRRFRTATFVAELLWVIGNTVWIIGELWWRDYTQDHRWVAATILFFGNVVALLPLRRAFGGRINAMRAIDCNEGVPLYGWKGKLRGGGLDRTVHSRPVRVV